MNEQNLDVIARHDGTIGLVEQLTPEATSWLADHLRTDFPRFGKFWAIDDADYLPLVHGMYADGLVVEVQQMANPF